MRDLLPDLVSPGGLISPASQTALPPGFPPLPALPETSLTPLPDFATRHEYRITPPAAPRLREGCHLIAFHPVHPNTHAWPSAVGTLRWEQVDTHAVVASGDLYRADHPLDPSASPSISELPGFGNHEAGHPIPSFPRDRYHAYFQIGSRSVLSPLALPFAASPSASVAFAGSIHHLRSLDAHAWSPGEPTLFHPVSIAPASPSHDGLCDRAKFYLTDATGTPLGELHVRWISPFFRDAVVEIDTEPGLPAPVDNATHESWETVFARVGWRLRTESGALKVPTPPSGRWSYAELHDAMLRSRSGSELDDEWRYHVSVVRSLADPDAPLGIAFDHEAMDLNGIPREGVALYAGARLPSDPIYGRYAGRIIAECPDLLFQIAIHEVGHAMGLYHNHVGFGIMDQVDDLAAHSPHGSLTAASLEPRFAATDIFRLRHLPDIQVRPGGTEFETTGLVEDRNDAHDYLDARHPPAIRAHPSESLRLHLALPLAAVPVGAPIRVDFHLVNRSQAHIEIPSRLGLGTPFVHGWITGPDGSENDFRSLFKPIAVTPMSRTRPGMAVAGSLTLLRGNRGALTARPGRHTLWIEIAWTHQGKSWCARQRVPLEVVAPKSIPEARASRRLLLTPQTLGYLVLGGSPAFTEGEAAIENALEVPQLHPHFAFIKAKAIAASPAREATDWNQVHRLLTSDHHAECLNRREREKARFWREIAAQHIARPAGNSWPAGTPESLASDPTRPPAQTDTPSEVPSDAPATTSLTPP